MGVISKVATVTVPALSKINGAAKATILKVDGQELLSQWLSLSGAASNYASTPDTAALDITGDITLVCRAALTDWTPAAVSNLVAKWTNTGNQRSYRFEVLTDGTLRVATSATGSSTLLQNQSTAATGFADGSIGWAAASLDLNDGAGNRVCRFYTSTTSTNDWTAVTWTQLGTTVTTAGAATIFSGSGIATVGGDNAGAANNAAGKFYAAAIATGLIGSAPSAVADPQFAKASQFTVGVATGTDGTGKTWTINTSGSPGSAIVST